MNATEQVTQFLAAAKVAGFSVSIAVGIVRITKTFTAGDKSAFVECDVIGPQILSLVPLKGGSIWGTDGGSVGGALAVSSGRYTLNKSGSGKAFVKALEAAVSLGSFFESRTRDSRETYYALKDGAPSWLQEAIHEAHQGDLPSDWVYETCYATCVAIDDEALDENGTHEFADSQVDFYTRDRFQWAAEMCHSHAYAAAEEQQREMGETDTPIEERLGVIQFFAIETIAQIILAAHERNLEDA